MTTPCASATVTSQHVSTRSAQHQPHASFGRSAGPMRSQFGFRGTRDYVHGTAIVDWLATFDDCPQDLRAEFHHMSAQQCDVCEQESSEPRTLVATYASQGKRFWLYEVDEPIVSRYACNEKQIVTQVRIDGPSACFEYPNIDGASFSQSIVAAYKHLLPTLYPDVTRPYVWTAVELARIPASGQCEVRHKRSMGKRFFEGQIFVDGQPLGRMYFGLRAES